MDRKQTREMDLQIPILLPIPYTIPHASKIQTSRKKKNGEFYSTVKPSLGCFFIMITKHSFDYRRIHSC